MSENAAILERPPTEQASTHEETAKAAPAAFNASEVQVFHNEDRHTGMAIVGIMMAIFVAAIVLYTGILIWVMQHPNQG